MMYLFKKNAVTLSLLLLFAGIAAALPAEETNTTAGEKEKTDAPVATVTEKETDSATVAPQETEALTQEELNNLNFVPARACGTSSCYDPFFEQQCRMMQQIMDEMASSQFFMPHFRGNHHPGYFSPSDFPRRFTPDCDLKELADSYEITMEVPGLSGQDLQISFAKNVLTVSGEKKEVKDAETENYRSSERSYGAFQRSFILPDGTNPDEIKAKCQDGILTIVVPKTEKPEEEVKTIPIES